MQYPQPSQVIIHSDAPEQHVIAGSYIKHQSIEQTSPMHFIKVKKFTILATVRRVDAPPSDVAQCGRPGDTTTPIFSGKGP